MNKSCNVVIPLIALLAVGVLAVFAIVFFFQFPISNASAEVSSIALDTAYSVGDAIRSKYGSSYSNYSNKSGYYGVEVYCLYNDDFLQLVHRRQITRHITIHIDLKHTENARQNYLLPSDYKQ